MCQNLLELNPDDVEGEWIEKSVQQYIEDLSVNWASTYDLVIGSDLHNNQARQVSERCNGTIPFVLTRQYGLIGSIRIDIPQLAVVESKEF